MRLYGQCATCGDGMELFFTGQETHPLCESTAGERTAREFVDAIQREDSPEIVRLEKLLNTPAKVVSLGSAAIWYAETARWPVFPLKVGQKVPATRNGFKAATRDLDQIRQWWSEADYNIGIPTGLDTYDALDVDGPEGVRSLSELDDGVIPDVFGRVSTPRGFHLLLKGTDSGNRAGVRKGLDYRSNGGFTVTVPSVVDGKRYSWTIKPSPEIYGKAP